MESPSMIRLPSSKEPSMFDLDGPPSSPFITEVETNAAHSCSPSKQFSHSLSDAVHADVVETSMTTMKLASPGKEDMIDFTDFIEDKENVPQAEITTTKINISPTKLVTPKPSPPRDEVPEHTEATSEARRSSDVDADLMPPPSIRKTPRKTPLRSLRDGGNSPRPLSRGNSYERSEPTPARTPSQFQAGLDARSTLQDTTVDDTCFSTFSEIPDMTLFAKLGQSPTKRSEFTQTPRGESAARTPRTSRKRLSASISRSPSPTPRRQRTPATMKDENDTTNFLIDFTQQLEGITRPSASISPAKSSTEPNLLQYINSKRSPAKQSSRHSMMPATPKQSSLLTLLDFELPPAPTPRSVPTITVRELESLKSSYLSQISSLKATLSGREAEVESLKRAVQDAERRVGEAQEAMREERSKREHVEEEKAGWERRGQEVEAVLKSVKEEVLKGELEKEDLARKAEESERRVEDAEARATKAEERFADALAARAEPADGNATSIQDKVDKLVAAQIDAKIEAVSRELHGVYKDKHERKVATLKKSYEARAERKNAELQAALDGVEKENFELKAAKDATFSGGPLSGSVEADAELKAQLEEQKASLARLEHEKRACQQQQNQLLRELERERIEKGDLVAAVDEMLALQADPAAQAAAPSSQVQGALSMVEDFRKSISRPSGLKPPGANAGAGAGSESRIGRGGMGIGGVGRSGSGKSRMLANIERMGRTGGGAVVE